jgi:subtilisin family serine protease
LAVLDTGMDLQHPDFHGRAIVSKSFIAGQTVQDGNSHGTHCIGTSCGPKQPAGGGRRYGVAFGAAIYAGKVLSNQGSGATGGIVAGIEWAVVNGCQIVSMSLGANINQKVQQYEVPIQRALNAGTLVIAAAGNNAQRSVGNFGFVTPPANADAAMAVAALDEQLAVADFSARSSTVTGVGGKVNIAGPGVRVYSSVPVAFGTHGVKSGTSMATPHVSGIAALWCQATGAKGTALWTRLEQSARPLGAPAVDVGFGLVQAPQ